MYFVPGGVLCLGAMGMNKTQRPTSLELVFAEEMDVKHSFLNCGFLLC